MWIWELILIAVGLSMDAFAVSICKGLSVEKATAGHSLIAGAYFGGFQALMPTIGYFLCKGFSSYIETFDHWIAFVLLAIIGFNMIWESRKEGEKTDGSFGLLAMLPLAISTSIDALATGAAFYTQGMNIWIADAVIGVITFLFSAVGVRIGNVFGAKYKSKAELAGGIILILMGTKILCQHLGLLPF